MTTKIMPHQKILGLTCPTTSEATNTAWTKEKRARRPLKRLRKATSGLKIWKSPRKKTKDRQMSMRAKK